MWDLHGCKNAAIREGEMAPRLNLVVEKARESGVLIIHAPSSCMAAYEGTTARERAKAAPQASRIPLGIANWCKQIPTEESGVYPIDQADGGCDDDPAVHEAWARELEAKGRDPKQPWKTQIDLVHIDNERDVVSDSGVEIWNVLEARGIENVILTGVHANMCVAGRPFGLRQMAKNGRRVVLMRDLTDSMYNPKSWPFVSHQRGTELFIEHVEKRICPTITSDQLIGGKPFAYSVATNGTKRLQILLLGDSTTEASIPKMVAPEEAQLEDSIRILLAAEKDLPPVDVYNLGLSGEFIRRLLDSGRYERDVRSKPQADYIFIRYGINDRSKRENFETNFPKDFHELLERLRQDHPKAVLIPMTVIPYQPGADNAQVNELVKKLAVDEGLPLFDIFPRYSEELKKGPNMLNYRRFPLSKVPESLHPIVRPYVRQGGNDPHVIVLDNRLDAHLGHLPGWFSDRHPNLAGYQVIASETAKYLATLMRQSHPAR
jgi:lysophospholipase L1-like esterase/nicotinamidase-related amidase